jgi:FAD/FMN-containing dehydrogenase
VTESWVRSDCGYEEARRRTVWNGRLPDRFPELIARPRDLSEVVSAVRLAGERGLRIGIRSGGHSWAASYLRDGGLLLDLSQMRSVSVDVAARVAEVEPGVVGSELSERLRPEGLFFLTGHCMSVGLGGFVLQGGFGWNSKVWGPACASVEAIEVVTAAGDVVRASERENPDLFWAARGSGPGFFGVVTRFWLRLHERPRSIMRSTYVYPESVLEEVLSWASEIRVEVAREVEAMVFLRRDLPGLEGKPGLIVMGPALTADVEQSRAALELLESCPVIDRAIVRDPFVATEMAELMAVGDALLYPIGARYEADNMWTNAPASSLLPGMRRICDELPAAPSHMMWMLWGREQELPDMSFSAQGELYIALYGIGFSEETDARHASWVTDNMRALEPFSCGIQLADENLGRRPFRFMSDAAFERLAKVRAQWDPQGMFWSYMGTPGSSR